MSKGDLDGITVFGRPFKPVAFGLALAMIVVAQANVRSMDRGIQLPLSWVVAVLSIGAVFFLAYGWIGRRQRFVEIGLLLVVGTYMTRGAFVMMSSAWDQAVFFSISTSVIAGGAYLLETNSSRRDSE